MTRSRRSVELARRLGKTPVVLDREIPGFIANRILGAVRDEAIYLLENGIASVRTSTPPAAPRSATRWARSS